MTTMFVTTRARSGAYVGLLVDGATGCAKAAPQPSVRTSNALTIRLQATTLWFISLRTERHLCLSRNWANSPQPPPCYSVGTSRVNVTGSLSFALTVICCVDSPALRCTAASVYCPCGNPGG